MLRSLGRQTVDEQHAPVRADVSKLASKGVDESDTNGPSVPLALDHDFDLMRPYTSSHQYIYLPHSSADLPRELGVVLHPRIRIHATGLFRDTALVPKPLFLCVLHPCVKHEPNLPLPLTGADSMDLFSLPLHPRSGDRAQEYRRDGRLIWHSKRPFLPLFYSVMRAWRSGQ